MLILLIFALIITFFFTIVFSDELMTIYRSSLIKEGQIWRSLQRTKQYPIWSPEISKQDILILKADKKFVRWVYVRDISPETHTYTNYAINDEKRKDVANNFVLLRESEQEAEESPIKENVV